MMDESKIATLENMRRLYAPGVFAWSPLTGEECSACPSDYFWLPEGESLTDSEGAPMILARQQVRTLAVTG